MKMIRLSILSIGILITSNSVGQQLPPPGTPSVAKPAEKQPKKKPAKNNDSPSKLSITGGIGIANYVGDLIKGNTAFQQSSFSVNAGVKFTEKL